MSRHVRSSQQGSLLLMLPLYMCVGVMLLITHTGQLRTLHELQLVKRSASLQQAFHAAEAGIDAAIRALETGALDTDLRNGPVTVQDLAFSTGTSYSVTVTSSGFANFDLESTGTVGQTERTIRAVVRRYNPLSISAATTIVGEGASRFKPRFFGDRGEAELATVRGCDLDNPAACLPSIAMTSATAYTDMASYVVDTEPAEGDFGDRLPGAQTSYTISRGILQNLDGSYDYSAEYLPQDIAAGGLGYDMLKSLAAFAKSAAQANGCYIDYLTDDSVSSNVTKIRDRQLGTAAAPKICYAAAHLEKNDDGTFVNPNDTGWDDVDFEGIVRGAGILVVEGELEQPMASRGQINRFEYDGLILSLGPTAEIDFHAEATVHGAALIGTTDPFCTSFISNTCASNNGWIPPEFGPRGSGGIQYSSAAVQMALALLNGWVPPHGSGGQPVGNVSVQFWSVLP